MGEEAKAPRWVHLAQPESTAKGLPTLAPFQLQRQLAGQIGRQKNSPGQLLRER
jgi:hypothetical protein